MIEYTVESCERKDIEDFIEKHHYSHNINGCITDYCFKLLDGNNLIGAMFYGRLAMANQWKRFSDKPNDVIELRRLVCIDDTPKNTESYFISRTIKWLKHNTDIKIIVSYADAEYGHQGTIYKASNFEYLGFKKGARVICYNNKKYHDKTIRTKYKGQIKPYAEKIIQALGRGEAFYKETKGKHTYIYKIHRKTYKK